jgi:N-acetylglucosamine kinase-like BadF-type ATPase
MSAGAGFGTRQKDMESYFLGIDGGGTKTAAVLLDGAGGEVSRAVSGPANIYSVGEATATASLRQAIAECLQGAGVAIPEVTAIGLGMAGVDRPGDRARLERILSSIGHFEKVVIVNDAEAALVGGVGRRYGVVLIAGTGAIAYGVNAAGESRRADGWGYLFGDEGSALWIGIQGLRAVARAHDGRGPATALTEDLITYLNLPNVDALVTLVYAPDFGVPRLAGLAPLVSRAAQAGDGVAGAILDDAGRRLGNTVSTVIEGLGLAGASFEVVLLGGVLRVRDRVYDIVIDELHEAACRCRVVEPRADAATGAALLARQLSEG